MSDRRGSPRIAREINDRLVLDLFAQYGYLTRSEIRDYSGLTQPTVLDIVDRLQRAGLIEAAGESNVVRRGPKALVYRLVQGRSFVVGVELLAGHMTAAVVDLNGTWVGDPVTRPLTISDPPDQVADLIDDAIRAAQISAAPTHIVVGVPSSIDRTTGDVIGRGEVQDWSGRLRPVLVKRFSGRLTLVNGVQLVGIAEGEIGAARDLTEFVTFWWGPGYGISENSRGPEFGLALGRTRPIGFLSVPGHPFSVAPHDPHVFQVGTVRHILEDVALHRAVLDRGLGTDNLAEAIAVAFQGNDPAWQWFRDDLTFRLAAILSQVTVLMDPPAILLQGRYGLAGGTAMAVQVENTIQRYCAWAPRVLSGSLVDEEQPTLRAAILVARQTARDELWGRSRIFTRDSAEAFGPALPHSAGSPIEGPGGGGDAGIGAGMPPRSRNGVTSNT